MAIHIWRIPEKAVTGYNDPDHMARNDTHDELLSRAVTDLVPRDLAHEKLASGKPLRLYLGIDPTGAQLHVGHSVPLLKLRAFQEAGHHVIFLIGSFTAMIGDPSGREKQREPLTREQVMKNFETYKEQARLILDFSKIEVAYNHEWLEKVDFGKIIDLASHFTVQQMLERDMYQKRIAEGSPIGLHEFLYPLMVGYDSVILDVDFEVGGNDQLFNMLAGRTLQKAIGKRDKFVLTTKLIEGTDGRKMSKTYNNCIYLTDAPGEMYGKVMSIKDELISTYFECCTRVPIKDVAEVERRLKSGVNPRDLKMQLARELVTLYHGSSAAIAAQEEFINIFQKRSLPAEIPEKFLAKKSYSIVDLLVECGLAPSKSEARRLVEGGGVSIGEEKIGEWKQEVSLDANPLLIKVGKRHFMHVRHAA